MVLRMKSLLQVVLLGVLGLVKTVVDVVGMRVEEEVGLGFWVRFGGG